MPDQRPDLPGLTPRSDLFGSIVAAVIMAGMVFVGVDALVLPESLKATRLGLAIQALLAALVAFAGLFVAVRDFRAKRQARQARTAVDEALKTLTADPAQGTVASVSNADVAATVEGTKISPEHLERLVEQRKQHLLVDKKTLRPELNYLIDNWHPLPRDVKRGLNRFYVSLLIAYNRGLLTSEDPVTGEQLAKWLVLSERWPQLGRALAARPDRIVALEGAAGVRPTPGGGESFEELIAMITPLYAEDEELRLFIGSSPTLATVLPRLVHYGAAQAVQPTAAAVQQVAAASSTGEPEHAGRPA